MSNEISKDVHEASIRADIVLRNAQARLLNAQADAQEIINKSSNAS